MIAVEPRPEALVAACASLVEPDAWQLALEAAALPVAVERDEERWLEEHVDIFRGVVAAG